MYCSQHGDEIQTDQSRPSQLTNPSLANWLMHMRNGLEDCVYYSSNDFTLLASQVLFT
jgi:hypothetical protein